MMGSKIPTFPIFLLDIIFVNMSLLIALFAPLDVVADKFNFVTYLPYVPWVSMATGFIFLMFNLYSNWIRKSIQDLILSILLATLTLSAVTLVFSWIEPEFIVTSRAIMIGGIFQAVSITLSRSLIWVFNKKAYGAKRVLVIMRDLKEGSILVEKILNHTKGWFTLVGLLPVNQLSEVEFKEIDIILINANIPRKNEIVNLCVKFGKEILIVPELAELLLVCSEPQQVDDVLVLSIRPHDLDTRQLFFKRLFDIIAALILLVVFSPIMISLFIVIPLSTKGPALYKQERLGKNEIKYLIYKFRSMNLNAEDHCGPILSEDQDPRITKIGGFIRATRFDELPQLFNVLKGQMSLVGPRPERLYFINQFEEKIPHYSYRMSIKPGITGLAQVMGKYSTTAEDKLRLDMMYMHSYSFALDLKILFQTIGVVLRREQAGGVKDRRSKWPNSL